MHVLHGLQVSVKFKDLYDVIILNNDVLGQKEKMQHVY